MLRAESLVSSVAESVPVSARSSQHPAVADDSYHFEDGDGYDPSMALSRSPNENFKVRNPPQKEVLGDSHADRSASCSCFGLPRRCQYYLFHPSNAYRCLHGDLL